MKQNPSQHPPIVKSIYIVYTHFHRNSLCMAVGGFKLIKTSLNPEQSEKRIMVLFFRYLEWCGPDGDTNNTARHYVAAGVPRYSDYPFFLLDIQLNCLKLPRILFYSFFIVEVCNLYCNHTTTHIWNSGKIKIKYIELAKYFRFKLFI